MFNSRSLPKLNMTRRVDAAIWRHRFHNEDQARGQRQGTRRTEEQTRGDIQSGLLGGSGANRIS